MSPPYQTSISLESIQAMTKKKPRRKQLGRQGKALLQLRTADKGWSIQFPFTETLWNSFAGARAVLGLACEKTCRNDDNVSHVRD